MHHLDYLQEVVFTKSLEIVCKLFHINLYPETLDPGMHMWLGKEVIYPFIRDPLLLLSALVFLFDAILHGSGLG